MIDKLTIEHIAPYLPYNLQIVTPYGVNVPKNGIVYTVTGVGVFLGFEGYDLNFSVNESNRRSLKQSHNNFKPILRPKSHLIKEITFEGDTFIPHDRLQLGFKDHLPYEYEGAGVAYNRIITNTMSYSDWLLCVKWKIDVFDLIKNDLAINIDVLIKNGQEMCGNCGVAFTWDWHHEYNTCNLCGNDKAM